MISCVTELIDEIGIEEAAEQLCMTTRSLQDFKSGVRTPTPQAEKLASLLLNSRLPVSFNLDEDVLLVYQGRNVIEIEKKHFNLLKRLIA